MEGKDIYVSPRTHLNSKEALLSSRQRQPFLLHPAVGQWDQGSVPRAPPKEEGDAQLKARGPRVVPGTGPVTPGRAHPDSRVQVAQGESPLHVSVQIIWRYCVFAGV